MGPNEILERLSVFGEDDPIPREVLAEAVECREAVTPLLLDRLDWLWKNVGVMGEKIYDEPEYDQSWYALFLLGQFRERLAYPKVIRLLSLDGELLDIALGDYISQAGNLLYSTFDGDLDSAKALAADSSLDPFARGAALDLMTGLAGDGRMDRGALAGFVRERLAAAGDGEDERIFTSLLANAAVNAGLFELTEDFRRAYRQGKVDTALFGDFDGFLDELLKEPAPAQQTRYMNDAVTELSDWGCFREDGPSEPGIAEIRSWNVGRNDPCPCGSGKKFKKCCLKRLEEWDLMESRLTERELSFYPPLTGQNGRPGLGDLFSQDAIAVDEPAYRAMVLLRVSKNRSRNEAHQARRKARELLWSAFLEAQRICTEQGISSAVEFDERYHVHYDCAAWLGPLTELLDSEDPRRQEVKAFPGGGVHQ